MEQSLQANTDGALRAVEKNQRKGHQKRRKRDEQFEEPRDEPRAGERLEKQYRGQCHAKQRGQPRAGKENPQRRANHTTRLRIAEESRVGLKSESAMRTGQTEHDEPNQRIDHQRAQHNHREKKQVPLRRAFAAAHGGRMRGEGRRTARVGG